MVKINFMNGSVQDQNQIEKQSKILKKLEEQEEISSSSPTGALFQNLSNPPPHQQQCTTARINIYIMGLPCVVIANYFSVS